MRLELLRPEEWTRIMAQDANGQRVSLIPEDPVPVPTPTTTVAFIGSDSDGQVAGRIYVGFMPVEFGVWIRNDHRGSTLLGHLQLKVERDMAVRHSELQAFTREGTMFHELAGRWGFAQSGWTHWQRNLRHAKIDL